MGRVTASLEQGVLYLIDRPGVRGSAEAKAIVDRCLVVLTAAKTADAPTRMS